MSYINKYDLNADFPNIAIVLRIMQTLPVQSSSWERPFSKLKLIKNYLGTISQERLTNLALISIENDLCDGLDIEYLVKDFTNIKAKIVEF